MTHCAEPTWRLALVQDEPVFSLAPMSTRMVAAYEDRAGHCQLVTDVLDHERQTPFNVLASWDAWIEHHASADWRRFRREGLVASRGKWTGSPATSDLDCVGAASPGVLVAGGRVWVYYACRGPRDPSGPFDIGNAGGDHPLSLPGRIMLASAPIDTQGALDGSYEKHGVVVDLAPGFRSTRLDDPCAAIHNGRIWLFFKAIGEGERGMERVTMAAHAPLDQPEGPYTVLPEPVILVPGGAEMPRVFRAAGAWHMLLRRFQPEGSVWEHYRSDADDPIDWRRVSARTFGCAGPDPGKSVTDICPVWRPFQPPETPPRYCFAAGLDDGTFGDAGRIKQWLYTMELA